MNPFPARIVATQRRAFTPGVVGHHITVRIGHSEFVLAVDADEFAEADRWLAEDTELELVLRPKAAR